MKFLLFLVGIAAFAQTQPTISNVAVTTDTNAAVVSYNVTNAGTWTISAATATSSVATLTIGSHSIPVGSYVSITGASPSTWNVAPFILGGCPYFCGEVSAVTGTTVSVNIYNTPGTYTASSGTLTLWPFCGVQYDTVSHPSDSNYLFSSYTLNPSAWSPGTCSMTILDLQDAGTYYFRPTARPDVDDETNVCSTSACGAVEQTATIPTIATSHLPALPASVASQMQSEINTTGYSIVPMAATGANNECAAQATVNPPEGYTIGQTWNGVTIAAINSGDTVTTILNPANGKLWYGTAFDIAQGAVCVVNPSVPANGQGYALVELPIDPCAGGLTPSCTSGTIASSGHRFIIFRSHANAVTDFPPFGVRTDPSVFTAPGTVGSHYAEFEMNTGGVNHGGSQATIFQYVDGSTHTLLVHHWAWLNLKFGVDETQTNSWWGDYFLLGSGENGSTPPYPQYITINRNWFHMPERSSLTNGSPYIQAGILGTWGGNGVIQGNYFDNQWTSGAQLNDPIYFTDCGATGACNSGGPVFVDGNYLNGMGNNIYIESNNPNNPVTPHDFTITHNALHWPYPTAYNYALTTSGEGCRNQLETKNGIRFLIGGNFINGQWACEQPGEAILATAVSVLTDLTIQSNLITRSAAGFELGSGSGGYGNIAYSKQLPVNRVLYNNNLLYNLGRGQYNAGGGGAATELIVMGGVANVVMQNNTIVGPFTTASGGYDPWVIEVNNTGYGPLAGLVFRNNIFPFGFSIALPYSGIYTNSTFTLPGVYSHPVLPGGAYSLSYATQSYSAFLGTVFGYASRTAGLGMSGATVVNGGSGYPASGNLIFTGCTNPPVGTFATATNGGLAGVINSTTFTSFGSACNLATMTVTADTSGGGSGASLRPGYGLTPSFQWQNNVATCTDNNGVDMSSANCASFTSTMPTGDVYPSQSTTVGRQGAAGLTGLAANNYNVYPTSTTSAFAGANIRKLEQDLGVISNIAVSVSASSAQITYTAPDLQTVYLDVSADGGTTWTRSNDAGGYPTARSISVTSLTSATTYLFRLLSHFDQTAAANGGFTGCTTCGGWFSFPSDPSNLQTDGAFTTLASVTRNPSFAFNLADFSGTDHYKVTMTAPDNATQYTNTCTASPCVVSSVPAGDYATVRQYLTGATVKVLGASQTISIR